MKPEWMTITHFPANPLNFVITERNPGEQNRAHSTGCCIVFDANKIESSIVLADSFFNCLRTMSINVDMTINFENAIDKKW